MTARRIDPPRVMPVAAVYRALMAACEERRGELGWSMATVDDKAGTNDGHYAKCCYPDTPSGRQAQYGTVDLILSALFGRGFTIKILPEEGFVPSALGIATDVNGKAREIRHWRHRRHFRELGSKGGRARSEHPKLAHLQSNAAKARWKAWRAQQRLQQTIERCGAKLARDIESAK